MQAKIDPKANRILGVSTVSFTLCFAVWSIFSIIGIDIKQQLNLDDTEFGLLIGTPVLSGSLVRLVLGVWADRYGGRLVMTWVMLGGALATFLLSYATTYPMMLIAALGVGIAGMNARLRQFGGRLEIASSKRGTTVRAIVPRPRHERVEDRQSAAAM